MNNIIIANINHLFFRTLGSTGVPIGRRIVGKFLIVVDSSENSANTIISRHFGVFVERLRVPLPTIDGLSEEGTRMQRSAQLSST